LKFWENNLPLHDKNKATKYHINQQGPGSKFEQRMHWLKPLFSGRQSLPDRQKPDGNNDCMELEVVLNPLLDILSELK
jgi:hypothetical protein